MAIFVTLQKNINFKTKNGRNGKATDRRPNLRIPNY